MIDNTSLFKVIENNEVQRLRDLLESSIECDGQAVGYAVLVGRVECLKLLLNHGIEYDARAVIDLVIQSGHVDCLEMLMDHGVKCDEEAVELAIWWKHPKCLELLLNRGVEFDPEVIELAALNGRADCLEILLNHGTHCNYKKLLSMYLTDDVRNILDKYKYKDDGEKS